MITPIVIGTSPGREMWLADCLASIKRDVIVLSDFTFELGKIDWMLKNTSFDRFLILHDSIVIKDDSFFDKIFEYEGSVSINRCPTWYGSFMGIFERKPLLEVGVPIPQNKKEAVHLEYRWTRKYCETAGKVTLMFPELRDDTSKIVMRHGRENILLENEYLIKYKGNWGQLADY
jgi:hypothetical protein